MDEQTQIQRAWQELVVMNLGWSLIPIEAQGKRAIIEWKQYQQRRASRQEIAQWRDQWPNCNIGVVTGLVSDIVVLDVDGNTGMHSLADMPTELPRTPKVKTASGWHYFFAYPYLEEGQHVRTKAGILPNVDMRGDGGYVVGPGSVHSSGAIYHWEPFLSPDDLPPAQMPEWLRAMVVTQVEDPLAHIERPIDMPVDASNERVQRYAAAALAGEVSRVENAIDGTKHDILLSSAAKLGMLIPLLDESTITYSLFDAVKYRAKDKAAALKTIRDGINFGRSRPRDIPQPTVHYTEYAPPPEEEYAEPQTEEQPKRKPWDITWATDLVVPPRRNDWIWEGYLAPREITLLTGVWKSGKTQVVSHLLKALEPKSAEEQAFTMPPSFVGQLVHPCKVLVVTEEGMGRWADRRDILKFGPHIAFMWSHPYFKQSQEAWAKTNQEIALLVVEHDFGLVIFDTIYNLWAVQNENDNPELIRALDAMQPITDAGAALLLMGHPSKMQKGEFRDARGGGALLGRVDTIMELYRLHPDDDTDTHRVIKAVGRDMSGATRPHTVINYSYTDGYTVDDY